MISSSWGREEVSKNEGEYELGEGGLAVSGHPFERGLCTREEGIETSFYHHLPVLKIEK